METLLGLDILSPYPWVKRLLGNAHRSESLQDKGDVIERRPPLNEPDEALDLTIQRE
jgi:hypothetical protein